MIKKNIVFLCFLFLLLIPNNANATEINNVFLKEFNGNGNDTIDIMKKTNNGYIAVGCSDSTDIAGITNNGGLDAIIINYDNDGNIIWVENYGTRSDDYFTDVLVLDDGYVAIGYSTYATQDGIIVKFDKDGNVVWETSYGLYLPEILKTIVLEDNGNFLISGMSISAIPGRSKAIVIECDADGNIFNELVYGGRAGNDYSLSIVPTENDTFVLVGYSDSTDWFFTNAGGIDAFILKSDLSGNELWLKSVDSTEYDSYVDVTADSDGNIIAVGRTNNNALISKYDTDGNLLWSKYFSESGADDYFLSVAVDDDGGYVVSGGYKSNDILENSGGIDGILIKYDKDGNVVWTNKLGGGLDDQYVSATISDGMYVTSGFYYSSDIDGLANDNTSVKAGFVGVYKIGGTKSITYDSSNGTINGPSDATPGENVTLNIVPDNGYKLSSVEFFDEIGNKLNVSFEDDKFIMPNKNINVKAIYILDSVESSYTDNPNTGDLIINMFIIMITSMLVFTTSCVINNIVKKNIN